MIKSITNCKAVIHKKSFMESKSIRTPLQKNQNLQNFFGNTLNKKIGDSSNKIKTSSKIKIKDLPEGSPDHKKDKKQINSSMTKQIQQSLPEINITVFRNFEKYENTSQHSQPQHFRKSSISSNSTLLGNRSTNSVFSYRSTSAKQRYLTDKTITVQKIDMRKLIQKKPDLYLDSAFTSTLDQLLEQSYQLVQTKKQQLLDLTTVEQKLQEEIEQLVQEVTPLQSQAQSKEETLFHSNEILAKYKNETKDYQQQIQDQVELRQQTEEEIEKESQKLFAEIINIQQASQQIQTDINVSKASHDLTKTKLQANHQKLKQNLALINEMLEHTKNIALDKQTELNEKTRKMENKSKMFIGMLGHF